MEKSVSILLEKTIEHWKGVKAGKERVLGDNCPLCQEFRIPRGSCEDCPIYKKTQREGCYGTPYTKFFEHFNNEHLRYIQGDRTYTIVCPDCEAFVDEEIAFLESLRAPKDKYYLKIANPSTAIGEEDIRIIIVNDAGDKILQGNLLRITPSGVLHLETCVNNLIGLKLDGQGRIEIKN
jgi:hypothetical protein